MRKLAAAHAHIVHEQLESRRMFSTELFAYQVLSPTPQHASQYSTGIQVTIPTTTGATLGLGEGTSPSGLASNIASTGLDISDASESLEGLSVMVIPASQLSADGFSSYNYPGDELIAILQWSSTGAGPYAPSTSVLGSSTGSNLGYSGRGTGGLALVPILTTPLEQSSTCNCNDSPQFDPATMDFIDELSTCGCDTGEGSDDDADVEDVDDGGVYSDGGDDYLPNGDSDNPVNYADGAVDQSDTDLSSDAFNSPWGITRNWTNNAAAVIQSDPSPGTSVESDPTTDVFGNNVVENQLGRAVLASSGSSSAIGIATNSNDIYWFNWNGSGYAPDAIQNGSLTISGASASTSASLTWTSESGNATTFYGFSTSVAAAQRGQFESFTDANGVTTTMTYGGSAPSGLPESLSRSATISGVVNSESYNYSYGSFNNGTATPSISIERVTNVQLVTFVGSTATNVQNVVYSYYGYQDPSDDGNFGDLETATVYDGSGTGSPVSTDYYRYYMSDTSLGYTGGLEFVVDGANYARLAAEAANESTSVNALSSSTVGEYANYQFTYDADHRVSSELVAGAGGTTNGNGNPGSYADGFGLYTYTYKQSANTYDYNAWTMQTVVNQPNGTDQVVFTNFAGEVMLSILDTDPSGSYGSNPQPTDTNYVTDYQYNAMGEVTQIAQPSANVLDPSNGAYNASNSDPSSGYISSSGGLIEDIAYGSTTTATNTSAGTVTGFPVSVSFQNGTGSVALEQESWNYKSNSGGATVYVINSDTTYGQTGGGDARTTTYAYTWQGSSDLLASITATFPLISNTQDGPGGTAYDTASIAYDNFGDAVWTQDGDGFISYTQYNYTTGAIVGQTADVNFSSGGSSVVGYPLTYLPSGWSKHVGGLNLAETMTVDPRGRTIQLVTPQGNVDDTVYDDIDHEIRVYDGVIGSSTLTAPAEIYDQNWTLGYDETLTYSGAIDLTANSSPNLTTGSSSIQTLSRTLYNTAGQQIETDQYFNLSSSTYSSTAAQFGSAGVNFYPATFNYDIDGNLDRVEDANGTITWTVYDLLDRPVQSWIGTLDTTTWSPTNTGGSNLVEVSATQYDNNGVGDSNVTQVTDYPGGSGTDQITTYGYDWRDRQVLETDGATSAQPIVTLTTYDNADEVIETQQYAGSGFTWGGSNSSLLRAQTTIAYDDQGRPYQTSSFSVAPSTSTMPGNVSSTAITSLSYYDHRGDLMAIEGPTGLWTKMIYDGDDRLSVEYQTDGAGGVAWNDSTGVLADAVTSDHVFSQTTFTYDGDNNIIFTASADRFGTDPVNTSATSVGPLGTPTSTTAPPARVSYDASYYDTADRDVADIDAGTFGGTAYTAPTVYTATGGSSSTVVDTAFSSSINLSGYTLAILTGPGAGERATITNYNNSTETFTFSTLTAPMTAPASGSTFIIVDPVSLLTQTSFNAAGWVQYSLDPKGIASQTSYDMRGNTTQTIADYTNGTPTASSNQTTDYTYDGDDNVLTMTAVNPGSNSQITHYVYGVNNGTGSLSLLNDNDLLYQVQYPDPTSGTNTSSGTYNQAETFSYDALGEQISYTDRDGTAHSYTYDALGRLTSDSVSAGAGVDSTVAQLTYAYNDAGLLSTASSLNSSGGVLNQVADTYDGFGNLLTEGQSDSGAVSSGTPTVSYGYDASNGDRQTSITYPDGRAIDYVYNPGLDSIASRISNVSSGSTYLQAYTYLGLDTPVTFTDQNGVELSYLGTLGATTGDAGDQYSGLDRFGRVVEQNWTGPLGGMGPGPLPGVDQFVYSYDQDSNVLSRDVITATASSTTNTNLAGQSQTYSYDLLNRLKNFSSGIYNTTTGTILSPVSTQGWSLDALGNWNSSSSGTTPTARTNSAQNQILTVGSATLDYDANGNTTTDEIGQEYVYDAWNRLVKVTGANATVLAEYSYDALGRRITETQGVYPNAATTDLYYSDADQAIQEVQGSLVTAEHVWSPFYVDAMIETDTDPQVTTGESNGSVDSGFGTNTSNSTTTTAIGASFGSVESAADGAGLVVVTNTSSALDVLFYNASGGLVSSTSDTALSGLSPDAVVVQANGYIDVEGSRTVGSSVVAEVVQLNSGGTVNTSFGTSGVKTVITASTIYNQYMALAANGDILVAVLTSTSQVVAEVNPSGGSFVSAFGTSGKAMLSNSSTHLSALAGLVVEPNGTIVTGGFYVNGTTTGVELAAFNTDGSTDTAFGSSGFEIDTTRLPGNDLAPLAVTAAGDILIGSVYGDGGGGGDAGFYLEEFNPGGTVNTSFGTNGVASAAVLGTLGDNALATLAIEPNGQIVVGGEGYPSSGPAAFYLGRFNANGLVDTTFGSSGVVTVTSMEYGDSMVMTASGKTVVIGQANSSSTSLVLQQFNTLAKTFTYYIEYDADYNVTSLTDGSGNVLERYEYDPYGNVTVLNADGTTRGDGTAASSFYGWVYLHQGLRLSVITGTYDDRNRVYDPSLGRFLQEDPAGDVDGPNTYQDELSDPDGQIDPSGDDSGGPTQVVDSHARHWYNPWSWTPGADTLGSIESANTVTEEARLDAQFQADHPDVHDQMVACRVTGFQKVATSIQAVASVIPGSSGTGPAAMPGATSVAAADQAAADALSIAGRSAASPEATGRGLLGAAGATGAAEAAQLNGGAAYDLALGLGEHPTGGGPLLENFASHVDAKTYFDLFETPWPGSFDKLGANITSAMRQAKNIRVNLDGMASTDICQLSKWGEDGIDFIRKYANGVEGGNITNWEIYTIEHDPALKAKVTYYSNGKPVP